MEAVELTESEMTTELHYAVTASETWVDLHQTYPEWVKLRDKLGLAGDTSDSMLASVLITFWLKYSPAVTRIKADQETPVTQTVYIRAADPAAEQVVEETVETTQVVQTLPETIVAPEGGTQPEVTQVITIPAGSSVSVANPAPEPEPEPEPATEPEQTTTQMYWLDTNTGKLYPIKSNVTVRSGSIQSTSQPPATPSQPVVTRVTVPRGKRVAAPGDRKSLQLKKRVSEQPVTCEVCGKAFSKQGNLVKHRENVHNIANDTERRRRYQAKIAARQGLAAGRKFSCGVCGKQFPERWRLNQHARIHVSVRPHTCPECGRGFLRKRDLERHLTIHGDPSAPDRPHVCRVCSRKFAAAADLELHAQIHSEAPAPSQPDDAKACKYCGKSFSKITNLKKHYMAHSRDPMAEHWPYACDQCPRKFLYESHLVYHRRRHSNERPYVCGTCQRSYVSRRDLLTHAQVHSAERPYKCTQCEKAFRSKYQLKAHEEVHAERRYQCETCNKVLRTKYRLLIHHKMHAGIYRYACAHCDRKFYTASQHRMHEQTHVKAEADGIKTPSPRKSVVPRDPLAADRKPYLCSYCPAAFRRREGLTMHEKVHTMEQKYQCGACGKRFIRRSYMLNHRKLHPGCGGDGGSGATESGGSGATESGAGGGTGPTEGGGEESGAMEDEGDEMSGNAVGEESGTTECVGEEGSLDTTDAGVEIAGVIETVVGE